MSETILITGGTKGIGLAAVRLFSKKGYRVFTIARRPSSILPSSIGFLRADLTEEDEVKGKVVPFLKEIGRIDVLINNVGRTAMGAVERTSLNDFRSIMESNLLTSVRLTQLVLPGMRKRKSGHIINISSLQGSIAVPFAGAYCASKAALNVVTEALAAEVMRWGVRVSLVHPGPVLTKSSAEVFRCALAGHPYRSEEAALDKFLRKQAQGNFKPGNLVRPTTVADLLLRIVCEKPLRKIHFTCDPISEILWQQRRQDVSGLDSLARNLDNLHLLHPDGEGIMRDKLYSLPRRNGKMDSAKNLSRLFA